MVSIRIGQEYWVDEFLRSSASCFILRRIEYLLLDLVLLLVEDYDGAAIHLREDDQFHFPTPQLSISQSAKILVYLNSEELFEIVPVSGNIISTLQTDPVMVSLAQQYLLGHCPEETGPIFGNCLPPQVLGAQELIQRHLKVVVGLGFGTFPPHIV
jgi:hypothetical protein